MSNDGGPAFPTPYLTRDGDHYSTEFESGMVLRDYFAAKALAGLFANPGGPIQASERSGWHLCNCTPDNVAELAYEIADAMLVARGAA